MAGQVNRLGLEFLTSGKSEQLSRESGSPFRRMTHPVQQSLSSGRIRASFKHLQTAGNHHQQIVEVMGNSASELPDRLDLLRLAKGLLDAGSFGDFPAQFAGAFGDLIFKKLSRPLAGLQKTAHFVLSIAGTDRGVDGT